MTKFTKISAVILGAAMTFGGFAITHAANSASPAVNAALLAAGLTQAQIDALFPVSTMTSLDLGPTTLEQGSMGQYVKNLQTFLGINADGNFGSGTKAAVMAKQAMLGLVADGKVGPASKAAFAASVAPVTPPASNGGSNSSSELEGGEGEISDADFISSYNNEEVGEDTENLKVLGLEIEAGDDSDIALTSVKVSFAEQGAGGSVDFDDYADSVSIWFGSEKVGSADVEDFNEDNDIWSKSISLDGVVIEAEDTEKLYVAVSSVNNIDSADLGSANNDWDATVTSIRYEDGDGALTTDTTTGDIGVARGFFFDTALSANDVELTVDDITASPAEQSVEVDEDGGDEASLLKGEFEADGSDVTVTELVVDITPAGTGDAYDIASDYILMIDGEEVASENSDDCTSGTCDGTGAAVEYTFEDFEVTVADGDTLEFEIKAVLNEISATFVAGDSLTASVDADDLSAETDSDDLTTSELNGTAAGEAQSFYEDGFSAILDEGESEAVAAGQNQAEFLFVVDITAYGDADVDLDETDFNETVVGNGVLNTDYSYSVELIDEDSNIDEDVPGTFTWNDETGTITFRVTVITLTLTGAGEYNVTLDDVDGQDVDEDLTKVINFVS